jgi:hypothetical protein
VGAGNVVAVGAGGVVSVGAGNVVSVGSGGIAFFDRLGNVVSVGAGNVTSGPPGNVVSVGAGNVVSVGAGNVVAVGAGNLTALNGAQLQPYLVSKVLESAAAGQLAAAAAGQRAGIKDSMKAIASGVFREDVRFTPPFRVGSGPTGAGIARSRRARPVVVWRVRRKFTRFGETKLFLKPTRAGLKLLRRIVKVNAGLRKRHRSALRVRLSVRATFKPRHGKTVKVTKRATTKSRRR